MKTLTKPVFVRMDTYDDACRAIGIIASVLDQLGIEHGGVKTITTPVDVVVTFNPPDATPKYDPDDPFAAAFLRR